MSNLNLGAIRWSPVIAATAAAAVVSSVAGAAIAAPQVSMAPPVSAAAASTPSGDSVFEYKEIPSGQRVPLNRAVFDQGGYQLYDTQNETIVVPFANQNLYVMKFAVSPDGTLFFVNQNGTPTLYVPEHGYLANATVPGAKWYPFSDAFHPVQPVYLGCAPSYSAFIGIGWYSNACIYGGYYCSTPFGFGGPFVPTLGLTFFFGGHHYYNWGGFHEWVFAHPGPYHVGYWHPRVYAYAQRSFAAGRVYRGGAGFAFHGRAVVASHGFAGHGFTSSGHVFRGAGPVGRGVAGGGFHSSGQVFRGAGPAAGGHSFGGAHNFGGGGSRSFGGGGARSFGGGASHNFGGGASHSFGGGGARGGGGGGHDHHGR